MRVTQLKIVVVYFAGYHEEAFFRVFSYTTYDLALQVLYLPSDEVIFIMNLKNRFLVDVCI